MIRKINSNTSFLSTNETTSLKAKYISVGLYHTIIIDSNNYIWSFGDNSYGQLSLNNVENKTMPTIFVGIKGKQVCCG